MSPRICLTLLLLGPLLAGASGRFQTSAEALSAAEHAADTFRAKTDCMADVLRRNADNNHEASKAAEAVNALIREKRKALQELAAGYYCSQCGRTASEIERQERKSFSSHLNDVKGRPIPAPANRIQAKAREYDQRIKSEQAKLERFHETWRGFVAEHRKCSNERSAAFAQEQSARNWALFLQAEERRKATAEAFRKMVEAREQERKMREQERKMREEAARLEKERRLAQVEREAARLMAQYRQEQQQREQQLAAAREAVLAAQRNLDEAFANAARNAVDSLSTSMSSATTPPPGALGTTSQLHAEQEADRIAGSILDPQVSAQGRENQVFNTSGGDEASPYAEAEQVATRSSFQVEQPRSSQQQESHTYTERAKALYEQAREWRSSVKEKARQLPEKAREQWQESRAKAHDWLMRKLELPTQAQLDAMDPLERQVREFWKVLIVRPIPVPINPFITHHQNLKWHDGLLDNLGRELQEAEKP
jgi:hypothetical protein